VWESALPALPITAENILNHPARLAVVEHLARSGGKATATDIGIALGERRRGCLHNHLNKLGAFGLVRIRRHISGRSYVKIELTLTITPQGRAAIAAINSIPMEAAA
jgi:hypothetical protein